jgi:MFS family permease
MNYDKNVLRLYIIVFFHNLIPAYVIERLFWENRGMTVLMVVFCEIIYAGTVVIFEIPSGILADKVGRKRLLVIGAIFSVLEFLILLFAFHFWTFALVVFLAGISKACTSGALNALLYDSLKESYKQNSFEKIIGRMNSLDLIASLIAALSGSVVAGYFGFEFNYIISAASMLIALGFTMVLKDPPGIWKRKEGVRESKSTLNDLLSQSIEFYRVNHRLVLIIFHAMAVMACVTYLDEFWQLYLNEIGTIVMFFGVFSAIISLVRIPGNLIAAWLIKHTNEEIIILAVLGITTLAFFIAVILPGPVGLSMIILIFLASGVIDPVITGSLHHKGSSEIRATIDSIKSMMERAITFILGIGFGIFSSNSSVIAGFFFLGIVTCLLFTYLLFKKTTSTVSVMKK